MQIPGYQIIRKISQGGMSSVYLAIQQSIGREVALKVISPALAQDQVFNERFNREANIIGQLSHPNIVAVYDIGSYRQLAYIAMDYLPGGSLSQRLCKGISSLEALRILKQLAAALAHAHSRGYIHRDIKPENILFRSDDTAVLTDFGVAKAVNHNLGMTNAGTVLGTPYYMSPEQAKGQPCDGRSDLYSLGVVFYEMLTAQLPYHAEEAVAIAIKHLTAPIPQLPAQYKLYQDLLERLLAKSPQDRVQSGAELVALIEQIETNMGIISPRAQLRTDPGSAELGVSQLSQTLVAMLWQQFIGLFKRHRRRTKINTLGNDKATAISQANSFTEPKQAASASAPFAGHRLIAIATLTLPLALVAGAVWQYSIKASSTGTNSAVVKPAAPNSKTQSFAQAPFTLKAQLAASRVNTIASPARVEMGAAQPPIRLVQAQTVTEPTAETNEEAEINTQTEELIEPASYTLRVSSEPSADRIRILNIKPRYRAGMALAPGSYLLELRKRNYHTLKTWVHISDKDMSPSFTLKPKYQAGDVFTDKIDEFQTGPELVMIDAGEFIMGSTSETNTLPLRPLTIERAFAVSRHEITFAQYQLFLDNYPDQHSPEKKPPADQNWGRGTRPVININWQQARDYSRWLSEKTGHRYRLLSEAEWEYMARAGSDTDTWWQTAKAPPANCKRGCKSRYSGLFGSKTAPVGQYPANGFGVYDSSGNVAEWVADCYRENYRGAGKTTAVYDRDNCALRSVRGGSHRDKHKDIGNHSRRGLAPEQRSDAVGFRVLREL